ncbi:hypothetical protein IT417_00800 [bacterium]|nr:hypothetical protein [bacterium]
MYSPSYTITHLILNYIVKIELAVAHVNSVHLPNTNFQHVYEKLHAEDIDKLGELIAYPIGYSKSLDVQRGRIMPSLKPKLRIFTNYRSTHDFIDSYTPANFIKPSFDLSVHINKLVMKGIVDDWDISKLRGFSDKPNETLDTWYKYRDFFPNLDPKKHFSEVYAWIDNPKIKVNKLIQTATLLYEYIDKAPFYSGNQITALLSLACTLKAYGYNPKNLLPLAKSIYFISEDLIAAYKISKNKRDLTAFIEAYLYTLSLTTTAVSNLYKDVYENKATNVGQMQQLFNQRQLKTIEFLEVEGKITRREYSKLMGISFMTAFRDLQELMDKGYIVQKGNGRGTHYTLPQTKAVQAEDNIQIIK